MWIGDFESTWIRGIAYDRWHETLLVKTATRAYQFEHVPMQTAEMFVSAASVGQFFGWFIRDHFRSSRITTAYYEGVCADMIRNGATMRIQRVQRRRVTHGDQPAA